MHEFGLAEAIVETAKERAGGRPVARVKVRMSALLRAEDESMKQAFTMISTGTEFEGADLEMVTIPGQGTCASCDSEIEVNEPWDPCPECGEHSVSVANGEEMVLEEIEYRPEVGTVP